MAPEIGIKTQGLDAECTQTLGFGTLSRSGVLVLNGTGYMATISSLVEIRQRDLASVNIRRHTSGIEIGSSSIHKVRDSP